MVLRWRCDVLAKTACAESQTTFRSCLRLSGVIHKGVEKLYLQGPLETINWHKEKK